MSEKYTAAEMADAYLREEEAARESERTARGCDVMDEALQTLSDEDLRALGRAFEDAFEQDPGGGHDNFVDVYHHHASPRGRRAFEALFEAIAAVVRGGEEPDAPGDEEERNARRPGT